MDDDNNRPVNCHFDMLDRLSKDVTFTCPLEPCDFSGLTFTLSGNFNRICLIVIYDEVDIYGAQVIFVLNIVFKVSKNNDVLTKNYIDVYRVLGVL